MPGWEDILFESRNKDYGAYQLRKKANKYQSVGLLLSVLLVFFVSVVLLVIFNFDLFFTPQLPRSITVESLQLTSLESFQFPEPPPAKAENEIQKFSEDIASDTVKEEIKKPDDLNATALKADTTSNQENENQSNGKDSRINGDSIIYVHVDKMPVFNGGEAELTNFLRKNLEETARKSKVRLKVVVQFTVTKRGETHDVIVVSGADENINKEVIRVISMFPTWEPALQSGRPVAVRFSLFINI